ncbi:Gamma-glutamyltranspeptidase precursor [Mycobacteroides salmoniphilum]|uniref:Gamma-glutamyltranspeptidase n=1 Tax=Mycobacteroides salmoniphilum TaxID=404941 RepID=A0A4V3HYK9_9MYCO|nr:gamma-glutamyltransferase family protein [Mycobacteroides salmoniphilum]TDZ78023.1 Gamma-glutamyltranspeptidase precursor [Mycobacteroides salmoniphilum]TDZ82653.1 Gamma-glutamyltranspeptidase precursor [Mycobacteroides salmoniphilum]TDZ85667.1 Gamma-glutamyltranspeptidase precursor [Mycobacteroides salmoniphilum]
MRTLSRLLAFPSIALLAAAGCSTDHAMRPGAGSEPCSIVTNGIPVAKTVAADTTTPRDISTNPEVATGYRKGMSAVRTASYAVATANPLATQAACRVLRDGGSAADALIAAQSVLGLVEPQSSGIGGGGFLVYYDAQTGAVQAYDGREVAPAAATENYLRWIDNADRSEPRPDSRSSGRSIGVPGILRMLHDAHSAHGTVPWRDLFTSAVQLADEGFDISPRLAAAISDSATSLALDHEASTYFLNADGSAKSSGTKLTNPAYAKTLGAIATDGPDAFYRGAIAEDIVAAAADTSSGRTPSLMTTTDLSGYTAKNRESLCTTYRDHEICGMPAPSSGGIAVAATLGILQNLPMASYRPTEVDPDGGRPTVDGVHYIAEAERLAYADRDKYVADTDFVALPGNSPNTLLNPAYLNGRAKLISGEKTMGIAKPGEFNVPASAAVSTPEHGTSQVTVVDAQGNAASLTTTVESAFGSYHMVDGFILNNQLTDFSAEPVGKDGLPIANRLQPGKRPRSSMAPTLVFERTESGKRGALLLAVGSPGGAVIIQFVVKTLVGILDWGLDPQQAVSMVDFGANNSRKTNVGGEHPNIDARDNGVNDPLVQGLRSRGHTVDVADQSSGLSALVRRGPGWIGGADPRREGLVMGDTG